jgi:3-deoxy-manno-octulosonate cytidylyltransferase (CMP-KDO synthetase)
VTASPKPRILGVIPARLASTRLPRKVLRPILGKPLLLWVYRAAQACPALDHIVVAADSPEVATLCAQHNIPCLLTDPALPSGTDRLHAVSQHPDYKAFDIYINIQGDEPLLHPTHITDLLSPFTHPHVDATTLKVPCRPDDVANPNAVKVVTALDGRALYFSRAPIPYDRDASNPTYFKHLGLYAYRRAALARFAALTPSPLEQTERLEQLRLLENNLTLYVTETPHDTIGVDTEADLLRVEALIRQQQS